jgi:methyl-accepting chemotaxis protein
MKLCYNHCQKLNGEVMTIKNASQLINALTICVIVLAAISLLNLSRKTALADNTADNRFYSILLVDELRKSSEELTRQVRNYAVTSQAAAENAYNKVLTVRNGQDPRPANSQVAPGQKRVLLDLLKEYGITDEEFSLVEKANSLSDNLVALELRAMNAVKGNFIDSSGQYTIHADPDRELAIGLVFSADYDNEVKKIMAPMDEFEERVSARTYKATKDADSSQVIAEIISFIALAIVLAFAVFNFLFNIIFIVRPLQTITSTLKTVVAEGKTHLGRRIHISGKNEIGELAEFFNNTFENIGGLIGVIKTKSDELNYVGVTLSSNMNETAAAVNQITANVQSIKSHIINQGTSVSATHPTMEQLEGNIKKLDAQVENQGSHISRASSAIEEMVANIHSVTDTLVKNDSNVKTLTDASDIGRNGLQGVSQDIQEIAKESEGLLEINSVMQNIASQTNLLSMNAAIEAAHAGELGKGFSVVADEIRKLAESSSQQSKTIGTVLKKIKESIDKISLSTGNVLSKFEAIDSNVKIVAEQEGNIMRAMVEQGVGSKQILEGMGNVNEITRQVASSTDEMLAGAQVVIKKSENLEKVTQEIASGITEMANGAEQINIAVHQVNEISGKNHDSSESLMREVSRFTVD